MNLDKTSLSVLRYVYTCDVVTYGELKKKFPKVPIFDLISALAIEKAIEYESVLCRSETGQRGKYLCDTSKISCTIPGKKYVEDYLEKQKEKRIEAVRYGITTFIAALALVLAAISLAAQLGLLQLPAQ